MKKLAALILSLALVLTVVPTAFAATKVRPTVDDWSIQVDGADVNIIKPGDTVDVEVVFDVSTYTGTIQYYDFDYTATTNNDSVEVGPVRGAFVDKDKKDKIRVSFRLYVDDSMVVTSAQKIQMTVKMTPDTTNAKRNFQTATFTKKDIQVKFEEFDIDDMYNAYYEMKDYGEKYMFFSPNTPVVSKEAIKFMRSKLTSSQYCYLDFGNYGVGITGAAAKKLSLKAINFGAKTTAVEEIETALEKAKYYDDLDYLTFISGDKLDSTAPVRVGVNPENGGSYVYRYLGNNLFLEYETLESDNYDLEFSAYIMGTYIITESKLPKSIVYKYGTTVSASKSEPDDASKTTTTTTSSNKTTTSSSSKTSSSSSTKKLTLSIKKK